MNLGFIGLGNMGSAIARNLIKAGHTVSVWNRTRGRAEELAAAGAQVAGSIAEACQGEAVMTMVSDDPAVESVVLGEGGILTSLSRAKIHVSMSTISVALSARLTQAHAGRGQGYVAAPVLGRPEAAAAAKLFVLASGSREAVERCRPIFEAIGQATFDMGEDPVAANVAKLSINLMIASVIESLAEAMALVRKHGIEPAKYLEVLTSTLFAAPVYKTYGALIAEKKYQPAGFKVRLGLKDVRLAIAAGEGADVPLPLASLIHDHYVSALARGYADYDWSALGLIAAEDAGLGLGKGSKQKAESGKQ